MTLCLVEVLFTQKQQVTFKILYQILTNLLVEKTSLVFVLILFMFPGILKNYYLYKLKKHITFLFGFLSSLIDLSFSKFIQLFFNVLNHIETSIHFVGICISNQYFKSIDFFQCDLHVIITLVNKKIKCKSRITFQIYLGRTQQIC